MLNIDMDEMNELMKAFYLLSGIRVSFFNNDFIELLVYPVECCPFCCIVKRCPETNQLCRESDKQAILKCRKTGHINIYSCYLGLTEVVVPIKINEIIVGHIMFGQVLVKDQPDICNDRIPNEKIEKLVEKGLNREELNVAKTYIKKVTMTELRSAVKIMEACTYYMLQKNVLTLRKDDFIQLLNSYIDKNISKQLTVDTVCSHFQIGRTRLYELAAQYHIFSGNAK
jgi:ligand-binding sensor protein